MRFSFAGPAERRTRQDERRQHGVNQGANGMQDDDRGKIQVHDPFNPKHATPAHRIALLEWQEIQDN